MSPPSRAQKNMFEVLGKIEKTLSGRKNANLFLDYDGTLAPIAQTPDKAHIPQETMTVLRRLSELDFVFIAVISGRSLEDIKKKVGLAGINYAGNHGLEISGVKRTEIVPNSAQVVRSINKISKDLDNVFVTVPGAWVENKSLTASVHYRAVTPNLVPEMNRLVGQITTRYVENKLIQLTRGNKVIEIRPAINWDKGKAVKWILKNIALKRAHSLYIGDDVTDESVFKILKDGITIKVRGESRAPTHALYYVSSPLEVRLFLQWLYERLTMR